MIIPALDIYNNNCVRLFKGKYSKPKIFCNNPMKVFLFFLNKKVKRLHLIDLNGAIKKNCNLLIICNFSKIYNYYKISKIQIGGGIRTYKKFKYFSYFFYKLIISTLIFKKVFFLHYFFRKIIYSIDIKNNFIYSKGWKKKECKLKEIKKKRLTKEIICTDINNDGTMKGLNINRFFIFRKIKVKLIISGGFKKYKKCKINNVIGFISGISIYKKKVSLKHAL
ncbi:HisA/HisF-related TIM barrel protein [Candidatus Vidania fulgoroideae]|uniref:HisA/HisF-related TIM barrel protein n=1 Tax=Candidatus Vidania fulgoroideorum TaxID=881286 RepID=A0AAX3N9V1_9PROT|nr:HisA/HisF-related TIM barrel protein [Candidatus Vidania fulgoroideae]WDR79356.1 HisA/HisF-related TIM barrel protein [Candidatus Vidania fulgoroideae]